MYIYSVTLKLDKHIESQWLEFMQQKHIGDVLAMGCFLSCSMRKLIDEDASHVTFNMQYATNSQEDYRRYQQVFGPALKEEVNHLFGGKFTAERAFYKIVSEHSA